MKPTIEIDLDEDTQRRNFRVTPHADDAVVLKIAGIEVEIVNISALGIAFRFPGDAKKEVYPIQLAFSTDRDYLIACDLRLIRKDKPEYAGEFENVSERDISRITSLIVECQKREIRRANQTDDISEVDVSEGIDK